MTHTWLRLWKGQSLEAFSSLTSFLLKLSRTPRANPPQGVTCWLLCKHGRIKSMAPLANKGLSRLLIPKQPSLCQVSLQTICQGFLGPHSPQTHFLMTHSRSLGVCNKVSEAVLGQRSTHRHIGCLPPSTLPCSLHPNHQLMLWILPACLPHPTPRLVKTLEGRLCCERHRCQNPDEGACSSS